MKPMKLKELKQAAYQAWKKVSRYNLAVVQPENFQQEVRSKFGDRRYKRTWVKALAYYRAQASYDSCLDAYMLILNAFNFTPERWDYEYRHEILDAFLMMPEGVELIRAGLEQLFSTDFTQSDREEANGFFAMVEERSVEGRGERFPVESNRRINGAIATAAAG